MHSHINTYDLNERLIRSVYNGNYNDTLSCLMKGGRASNVSVSTGRSAVGTAAMAGHMDILKLLIQSCEEPESDIFNNKCSNCQEVDLETTPDGMDCLEWEDEFLADLDNNSLSDNDDSMEDLSSLYYYYAKTFELTGSILNCTKDNCTPLCSILNKKQDPHNVDALYMTPVHYAAAYGQVECLHILLEHGAKVNVTDAKGYTPLHMGIQDTEVTRLLLKYGANVNSKTFTTGDTPLHAALLNRCSAVAKIILQSELVHLNESNDNAQTHLMYAIAYGQHDIAMELISRRARLNLQDKVGRTALYYAVMQNNVPLAACLLENGARRIPSHFMLHQCISRNMSKMLHLLVKNDVNGLYVRNVDGYTPIDMAVKLGRSAMLDYMLNLICLTKSNLSEFYLDDDFFLAIECIASFEEFKHVARILLSFGARDSLTPPRQHLKHSLTLCRAPNCGLALTRVIMQNKLDVAEFLLKEGADLQQICPRAIVHLKTTMPNGSRELLKLLIHMGFQYCYHKSIDPLPGWTQQRYELELELRQLCMCPLKLQALTRNCIRKHLLVKFYKASARAYSQFPYRATKTKSTLQRMVEQLEIPKLLQTYLIDFNDCDNVQKQQHPPEIDN